MNNQAFKIILICFFLAPTLIFAQRVSLIDAVRSGVIIATFEDNGNSTSDRNINISLNNMTGDPVDIMLEAGTMLDPVNPDLQEHVITQSQLFALAPFQSKSFTSYGMCTQGSKGGPAKGDTYELAGKAGEELSKLIKVIERNHYQDGTAQNAVWAITDRASIAGIYDEDDDAKSKALAEFVADIRGEDVPWYNLVYQENATEQRMFTGDVARLDAVFRYSLLSECEITFGIYHPNGEPLQIYFENRKRPKGAHRLKFSFEATGIDHGTYQVRLFANGKLIEDRAVEL